MRSHIGLPFSSWHHICRNVREKKKRKEKEEKHLPSGGQNAMNSYEKGYLFVVTEQRCRSENNNFPAKNSRLFCFHFSLGSRYN